MMDPVDVFQALRHPIRQQLLRQFPPHGELSRDLLASAFDESPSNMTQHIRVLTRAHLITVRKYRGQRYYSLRRDTLLEIQRTLGELARPPRRAHADRATGPEGHDTAAPYRRIRS